MIHMSAPSSYVHAIDGRLRIKVPVIKGSPTRAGQLERALEVLPGIQYVKANPTTGNVLVLFDSRILSQQQVVQRLAELGCFMPALNLRHSTRAPLTGRIAETVVQSALQIALERVILSLV
jgi:copper chaperone CopZ